MSTNYFTVVILIIGTLFAITSQACIQKDYNSFCLLCEPVEVLVQGQCVQKMLGCLAYAIQQNKSVCTFCQYEYSLIFSQCVLSSTLQPSPSFADDTGQLSLDDFQPGGFPEENQNQEALDLSGNNGEGQQQLTLPKGEQNGGSAGSQIIGGDNTNQNSVPAQDEDASFQVLESQGISGDLVFKRCYNQLQSSVMINYLDIGRVYKVVLSGTVTKYIIIFADNENATIKYNKGESLCESVAFWVDGMNLLDLNSFFAPSPTPLPIILEFWKEQKPQIGSNIVVTSHSFDNYIYSIQVVTLSGTYTSKIRDDYGSLHIIEFKKTSDSSCSKISLHILQGTQVFFKIQTSNIQNIPLPFVGFKLLSVEAKLNSAQNQYRLIYEKQGYRLMVVVRVVSGSVLSAKASRMLDYQAANQSQLQVIKVIAHLLNPSKLANLNFTYGTNNKKRWSVYFVGSTNNLNSLGVSSDDEIILNFNFDQNTAKGNLQLVRSYKHRQGSNNCQGVILLSNCFSKIEGCQTQVGDACILCQSNYITFNYQCLPKCKLL